MKSVGSGLKRSMPCCDLNSLLSATGAETDMRNSTWDTSSFTSNKKRRMSASQGLYGLLSDVPSQRAAKRRDNPATEALEQFLRSDSSISTTDDSVADLDDSDWSSSFRSSSKAPCPFIMTTSAHPSMMHEVTQGLSHMSASS